MTALESWVAEHAARIAAAQDSYHRMSPDMMSSVAGLVRDNYGDYRVSCLTDYGSGCIFVVSTPDGSEFRLYADAYGNVVRVPDVPPSPLPADTKEADDDTTVWIYVPSLTSPEGQELAARVKQGSAIVGLPYDLVDEITAGNGDQTQANYLIHFEGNVHNAANMKTFGDRVHHAASRLCTSSPTTAQAMVSRLALFKAGTYDTKTHRFALETLGAYFLASWLDIDRSEVAAQLEVTA